MFKIENILWLKTVFFTSLLIMGCTVNAQKIKATANSKPNVLVIYSDDHRHSGVHCFGNNQIQTPNIDALAKNGIKFNNAYLMGSFSDATCIPSRAMLMTGREVFKLENRGHTIPETHTTMGNAFQKAGYHTHIVGKWHNDNASLVRSFKTGSKIMGRGLYLTDQYRMPLWDWDIKGEFNKADAFVEVFNEKGDIVRRAVASNEKRGPIGTEKNGPHISEILANSAVNYIQEYNKSEPLFMYLAFPTPHDPRQAPEKTRKLYPVDQIEIPPSYMPQHPFDNGHMVLRDEELAPWPRTPEIIRQELADYYSIITHLDEQIGKVITALKASGQYENTIIVFAGDSGLAVGNHGLLGKQNIYDEDGLHVPFIISGGKIEEKEKEVNVLTYIHDIFPTVCELANIPQPTSALGKSLVPVIKGETSQFRDYTYHAYKQFQRAYRKGDYKLIEYVRAKDYHKNKGDFIAGSKVTQLFNIKKDPWETTDLSFFPEYKELVAEMRTAMKEKSIELGDNKEGTGEKYDFWDFY